MTGSSVLIVALVTHLRDRVGALTLRFGADPERP